MAIKILFITLEPPDVFSGGGLVVRQSILSLSGICDIDYLGPEISDQALRSKINKVIELEYDPGYARMANMFFRGITTGYYRSWLNNLVDINWDSYDLVYLEYSRHDFIARHVKKNARKLIVRVHNVEKDYYSTPTMDKKSFQNSFHSLIKRFLIAKQESSCLVHADCIICLTESDKARLIVLYAPELRNSRLEVIPVSIEQHCDCFKPSIELIERIETNPYLLITGSLWFGPNACGSAWFIKNVWHRLLADNHQISLKYKLIIAGSKPGKEIKSLVSYYKNIELIESPIDMKPYFENASIYLAPIFHGAGMKVKVAEALSFGLPVIGTSHAFNGYMINHRLDGYRADEADQFIASLEHYTSLSIEAKRNFREKACKIYRNQHSIETSTERLRQIISSLK